MPALLHKAPPRRSNVRGPDTEGMTSMPEQAYKRCCVCGSEKQLDAFNRNSKSRDGRDSRCRDCARERQREYRLKNPNKQREWEQRAGEAARLKRVERNRRWREENKEKRRAQLKLSKAIERGVITRPDICERCHARARRIEGHHFDYSKPLEVEWLCTTCHRLHHGAVRRGEAK